MTSSFTSIKRDKRDKDGHSTSWTIRGLKSNYLAVCGNTIGAVGGLGAACAGETERPTYLLDIPARILSIHIYQKWQQTKLYSPSVLCTCEEII